MLQISCIFAMIFQMEDTQSTYKQSTRLDTAGFIASFICAVHCAFMPLLLASLPMTGLAFLANPLFEAIIIAISFAIASISLFRGYFSYHHKVTALAICITGFLLIAVGTFTNLAHNYLLHAFGALFIAGSHIVNHFLTRASLLR
jgi:hypothetical protein